MGLALEKVLLKESNGSLNPLYNLKNSLAIRILSIEALLIFYYLVLVDIF